MNLPPDNAATTSSAIRCDSLCVDFSSEKSSGVRAVDDVCLEITSGEILFLIGPSGCGKTTLLRAIAGLQATTSGSVVLDPPAIGERGEIAFVFQQPSLLPWRTAIENVMLPLELIGHGDRKARRERAAEMLQTVQLGDAMNRMPDQLSGGMKMRVSIARALVTRPSVLLLDEPFAALDDMLRNQLGELLLSLWRSQQFTAVMVTHNIAESILMSHRIAVMHEGRVGAAIQNPLPRPRSESARRTPEFGEFYGQISDALRASDAATEEAP